MSEEEMEVESEEIEPAAEWGYFMVSRTLAAGFLFSLLSDTFTFSLISVLIASAGAGESNPFYGGIQWSPNGPVQGVTFNHLPQHAIIRIFTLNGVRVRKFEKRDDTQFLHWDLKSQNGSPVASGLYIVHIDMPELKKTKKLKLMIIQGEH